MTIQEYISLGLLESYVLGLTSEEETREIEALALQHEIIREEIAAIEGALETYAMQFAQDPPPKLKSKVMDSLAELAETTEPSQPFIAVARPSDEEEAETEAAFVADIPFRQKSSQKLWLAAASIVLGFSFLGNVFFYQKWKRSESELAQVQTQTQQMALQTQMLQTRMNSIVMTASVVTNPEYHIINMMAMEKGMDAMVVLYWHPAKGNLYVSCKKLPPLPPGKEYRLWLITGKGPIWAGQVPVESSQQGLVTMRPLAMPAAAFAITAEDVATSTEAPAGKMYVKGNV